MKSRDIEFLRKVSFFSDLNDELLNLVIDVVEEKRFSKNKIIFFEGDPGTTFYFVKSGRIKVSKLSETGREIIVHILGPGDIFAEVTLFQKDSKYPATAEVLEDAVVGTIRNTKLENLVLRNPQMALELIRALSNKLLIIQERIRHLGVNDAVERTIQVLLALAEGHGTKKQDGIELCANITRQDLAAFVGTTRETISRILSKLNQADVIDISGKSIIIKDIEGLKNW
ncbi:MAG: family transcriptional regulator, cyclic receptor protein [Clostridia bacterium]|nr:family transcriptional regulator, cyclic receptor protein [Clostridia bacterium]